MKALQTEKFKKRLSSAIEEIEAVSQVEIVSVIHPKSGSYMEIPLLFGSVAMLAVFTFLMFFPVVFGDYLFYTVTTTTFLAGVIVGIYFPALQLLTIKKTRLMKNTEIMARAVFQKAGIYNTKNRVGILVFISFFEKQAAVIMDKGVEEKLPGDIIDKMRIDFTRSIKSKQANNEIIRTFETYKSVFEEYIPQTENDVNELPESIEIDF